MEINSIALKVAVRAKLLIADRRDRLKDDAGLNTLEYVVLAAIFIPAVILLGTYLVGVIQNRQAAIQ